MKQPPGESRSLVWSIIGVQFIVPFMVSGVTVTLPAIGAETGSGATSLGLFETLFLAGSVAVLLPAGRLADATDKATIYKLGLTAFGITTILVGLLSSMPAMLAVRFLQGAASALVSVAGPALLAECVPREHRGRFFGAMTASIYTGLTLGPIVAGLLVEAWGWRAVFAIGGIILIAARLLTQFVLRSKWRTPAPGAVHLPSTALVAASMLLFVSGTAYLSSGIIGYAVLVAGVVLGLLFVRIQRRLPQPLVDVNGLIQNLSLRTALLVRGMIYTNTIGTAFLLTLYLQSVLGHGAALSGQVLGVGSVLMAVVAPFSGALSDRYRPGPIAIAGVALIAVGGFVFASLSLEHSSLYWIATAVAIQGIGFAVFSSPNQTIIMNSVPPEQTSSAAALISAIRFLGMLAGMTLVVSLMSLYLGNEQVNQAPARFMQTMTTAFWILALLTSVAVVVGAVSERRLRNVPSKAPP